MEHSSASESSDPLAVLQAQLDQAAAEQATELKLVEAIDRAGRGAIPIIAHGLKQLPNLSSLIIWDGALDNAALAEILPAIAGLRSLKSLDCYADHITSASAQSLARLLDGLSELTKLKLWSMELGPEGYLELAPAIQKLHKLQVLSLRRTNLDSAACRILATALHSLDAM